MPRVCRGIWEDDGPAARTFGGTRGPKPASRRLLYREESLVEGFHEAGRRAMKSLREIVANPRPRTPVRAAGVPTTCDAKVTAAVCGDNGHSYVRWMLPNGR